MLSSGKKISVSFGFLGSRAIHVRLSWVRTLRASLLARFRMSPGHGLCTRYLAGLLMASTAASKPQHLDVLVNPTSAAPPTPHNAFKHQVRSQGPYLSQEQIWGRALDELTFYGPPPYWPAFLTNSSTESRREYPPCTLLCRII
jgi:hypothetical protein